MKKALQTIAFAVLFLRAWTQSIDYPSTFWGQYVQGKTENEMTLYRYYGTTGNPLGEFYTSTPYLSPEEAKSSLGLPPWNQACSLAVIKVPEGVPYTRGKAAGCYWWTHPDETGNPKIDFISENDDAKLAEARKHCGEGCKLEFREGRGEQIVIEKKYLNAEWVKEKRLIEYTSTSAEKVNTERFANNNRMAQRKLPMQKVSARSQALALELPGGVIMGAEVNSNLRDLKSLTWEFIDGTDSLGFLVFRCQSGSFKYGPVRSEHALTAYNLLYDTTISSAKYSEHYNINLIDMHYGTITYNPFVYNTYTGACLAGIDNFMFIDYSGIIENPEELAYYQNSKKIISKYTSEFYTLMDVPFVMTAHDGVLSFNHQNQFTVKMPNGLIKTDSLVFDSVFQILNKYSADFKNSNLFCCCLAALRYAKDRNIQLTGFNYSATHYFTPSIAIPSPQASNFYAYYLQRESRLNAIEEELKKSSCAEIVSSNYPVKVSNALFSLWDITLTELQASSANSNSNRKYELRKFLTEDCLRLVLEDIRQTYQDSIVELINSTEVIINQYPNEVKRIIEEKAKTLSQYNSKVDLIEKLLASKSNYTNPVVEKELRLISIYSKDNSYYNYWGLYDDDDY